jgi:S1-C subfamily serine protease
VRVSRRLILGSAGLLVGAGFLVVVNLVVTLQQEIQRNRDEVAALRELTQEQREQLSHLEGQLGEVGRELIDVKKLEADARSRLMAEIEARTGTQSEERRREFERLEERIQILRKAADEHARLLAASRASEDLDLRYRELMSPTVRINARHEVGSGTVVWSRPHKKKARTYILTAWHIVQDNLDEDGRVIPLEIDFYSGGELVRSEPGQIVAHEAGLDLALLEVRGYHVYREQARITSRAGLEDVQVFAKVYAIGCPLGYSPLPTSGELTSKAKELDGNHYWMINAPTIFGNSGGGIYDAQSRTLIGVLSRISAYKNMIDVAVPHMGLVTSMDTVYAWLDSTRYAFVYQDRLSELRAGKAPSAKALPASAGGR